jgi:hypothetical protein
LIFSIAYLRKYISSTNFLFNKIDIIITLLFLCVPFSLTAKQIEDSDGDGLSDQYEMTIGTETYLADTDGDGINDGIEVGSNLQTPLDSDGDKRIDALDYDDDNDGLPTILENREDKYSDIDKDGLKNYLDNDADNDGIFDGVEAGVLNKDNNLDGIDDAFDVEHVGGSDKNGDGISDTIKLPDLNNDGIADYLDPKISNALNIVKIQDTSKPFNNIGVNFSTSIDNPEKKMVVVKKIVVNRYTDTDNDGLLDSQEIILGTNPLKRDSDGDGVSDAIEIGMDINSPQDSDHDNKIDALDSDDDNDGILTKLEDINKDGSPINDDIDDDGVPNYLDGNDDGDKRLTITEGDTSDTDNDGILDYLDKDDGKKHSKFLTKKSEDKESAEPEIIVLFDGSENAMDEELVNDEGVADSNSNGLTKVAKQLLNDVAGIDNDNSKVNQDSKLSKDTQMTQVKKTGAATWSWTFF